MQNIMDFSVDILGKLTDQVTEQLDRLIVRSLQKESALSQNVEDKLGVAFVRKKGDSTRCLRLRALSGDVSLEDFKQGEKKKELVRMIESHLKNELGGDAPGGWTLTLAVSKDSGYEEGPEQGEGKNAPGKRRGCVNLPQSGGGKIDRPGSAVFGLTSHKTGPPVGQDKALDGAATDMEAGGATGATAEVDETVVAVAKVRPLSLGVTDIDIDIQVESDSVANSRFLGSFVYLLLFRLVLFLISTLSFHL